MLDVCLPGRLSAPLGLQEKGHGSLLLRQVRQSRGCSLASGYILSLRGLEVEMRVFAFCLNFCLVSSVSSGSMTTLSELLFLSSSLLYSYARRHSALLAPTREMANGFSGDHNCNQVIVIAPSGNPELRLSLLWVSRMPFV